MRIILEGEPKEIAALVLAVQERQTFEKKQIYLTIEDEVIGTIRQDSHG